MSAIPREVLSGMEMEQKAILRRFASASGKKVDRLDLMAAAAISIPVRGPVSAFAAFHFHLEQVRSKLRRLGVEIVRCDGERYVIRVLPVRSSDAAPVDQPGRVVPHALPGAHSRADGGLDIVMRHENIAGQA